MKWIFGRTAIWGFATIFSAAAVFAAGQIVHEPERGELIKNRSCIGCHDFRPIETSARDQAGWTTVVNNMVAYGAVLPADDVPALVDYLVRYFGPVPDGPGRPILLNNCTMCHDLQRVKQHRGDRTHWEELLVHMINEGADLSTSQFPVLLDYLATNFASEEE